MARNDKMRSKYMRGMERLQSWEENSGVRGSVGTDM